MVVLSTKQTRLKYHSPVCVCDITETICEVRNILWGQNDDVALFECLHASQCLIYVLRTSYWGGTLNNWPVYKKKAPVVSGETNRNR